MVDNAMCYVASKDGMPGFCAAAVDEPKYKKDTAKEVAGWVRDGLTVTRVSVEKARAGLGEYFAAKKSRQSP